jgi:hypothetical protein
MVCPLTSLSLSVCLPVLGMSGTFDEQLWLDMAILASTEARALNNGPASDTFLFPGGGLTYFSPDINIFRSDPPARPPAPARPLSLTRPSMRARGCLSM